MKGNKKSFLNAGKDLRKSIRIFSKVTQEHSKHVLKASEGSLNCKEGFPTGQIKHCIRSITGFPKSMGVPAWAYQLAQVVAKMPVGAPTHVVVVRVLSEPAVVEGPCEVVHRVLFVLNSLSDHLEQQKRKKTPTRKTHAAKNVIIWATPCRKEQKQRVSDLQELMIHLLLRR